MANIIQTSYSRPLNLLFFIIGLLVACGAAAGPFLAVPQFRSNFSALGVDLPWFTQVVMSYYPAVVMLPMAVLFSWWVWPDKSRRGIACLVIGVGGAVLLTGLLVAALQYPIFQVTDTFGSTL